MKIGLQALRSAVLGLVAFGLLLFLPAGTFDYWQAWAYIGVFVGTSIGPSIYLAVKDPAALERRMQAGPGAETRMVQKVIVSAIFAAFGGLMVLSALDHRFGWSSVPPAVSVAGDALVAIGLGFAMLVVIQNSYAAANVRVESGQQVVTTGVYGFVRHPMYVGALILMIGTPLALGSWWGLLFLVPGVAVLVFRILDEEKLLRQDLAGYDEYAEQVRYRLVPHVW
jgi:protein-S-isoprenylcysteine O-methyltransferase Ste14